jgi:hypothetical protein
MDHPFVGNETHSKGQTTQASDVRDEAAKPVYDTAANVFPQTGLMTPSAIPYLPGPVVPVPPTEETASTTTVTPFTQSSGSAIVPQGASAPVAEENVTRTVPRHEEIRELPDKRATEPEEKTHHADRSRDHKTQARSVPAEQRNSQLSGPEFALTAPRHDLATPDPGRSDAQRREYGTRDESAVRSTEMGSDEPMNTVQRSEKSPHHKVSNRSRTIQRTERNGAASRRSPSEAWEESGWRDSPRGLAGKDWRNDHWDD